MTAPTDDWDAEYGEGGPAHAWFERYLGAVEQAAAEPGVLPVALRGPSSSVPPNKTAVEEDRVARELVPLVRAAAAEVPLPERVEVLSGQLHESRDVDGALSEHVSSMWWAREETRWRRAEESAFAAHVDRVMNDRWAALTAPSTEPMLQMSPEEFMTSVREAMLGIALIPAWRRARTEPIKLTREQLDRIPKAEPDSFLPWNPAATLLAGVPVIEVGTVEESTLHTEGVLLTLTQIARGALQGADQNTRWHTVPLYMTALQLDRVMHVTGSERPDNWEETLDRGGKVSSICSRDVFLADRTEDSTPCIERWMDR
jgi:hypothetical protein